MSCQCALVMSYIAFGFCILGGCMLGDLFSDHSRVYCFMFCMCRLENGFFANAYRGVTQSYIKGLG